MRTYLTGRNLIIDTKIHLNFILYLTRYTILSTNFSACIHKNMNFHKYTQSLIIDINRPKCPYTFMNISIDCSMNFIYFIRETPLQRTTSISLILTKYCICSFYLFLFDNLTRTTYPCYSQCFELSSIHDDLSYFDRSPKFRNVDRLWPPSGSRRLNRIRLRYRSGNLGLVSVFDVVLAACKEARHTNQRRSHCHNK